MGIEGLFQAIKISASGLSAQRRRMNETARNIANVDTLQTEQGGPYRRKMVILREVGGRSGGGFRPFRDRVKMALRLTYTHAHHIQPKEIRRVQQGYSIPSVEVAEVVNDPSPPRRVYDPSNPYADAEGYVSMPNVNIVTEMVNMMLAARAYDANATVISAAKEMAKRSLEI